MTDPLAAIAEGVKLVPELERALGPLSGPQYPVTLDIGQCRTIIAALTAAGEMAGERQGCKMAWKQGFCYGDPEYYPPAAIEALTPMASGTSVVVPVAELQPFADLVSTKNDYDLSTDDEIIRSAGTYGRDYCHITVGDCRRLKDRLHRKG